MLKKIIIGLIALVLVAVGIGFVISGPANASEGDQPCVPSDAYDEVIHHDAVTHVVHHDAVTHVVHHDAVTHVVHHDAVPAGPDLWWNWSPNHHQGPQDYEPAFPVDERGTWQGPHENGGPDQDTYGTFNSSNNDNGRSSWFHREHGTPGVDAYDETIVDQEAYDETVVDSEAYDETVVDAEAYDETIHHDAVTCEGDKPDPIVTTTHTEHHYCGEKFYDTDDVTTTIDWVLENGEWVQGEPVVVDAFNTWVEQNPTKCPTHNTPQPAPPVKHNAPAPVPTVIDAGL